ncbi:unnamed protein product [Allacma fusca]|uniref:Carboxylesterase type B domain-containing protein n=1 Tax=Allacma fusca TaxID=39272 RepID=A0A8J2K6J9_9HEXA|nr:unnamed protein product [Allacma fusca]
MSLIESAQHAPLASEEKSLDKLEIEMEEKEHMIKDSEGDNKVESEPTDKSKKDEESKTPRRPLLNIKIPQILRKRSKERPPEKGKGKNEEDKTEKELLHEAPVQEAKDEPQQQQPQPQPETERSFVTAKEVLEKDKPSEASFLSSFSTPKWPNFRRVFSFNRSTPVTMTVSPKQDSRVESTEPATVTLDIPEDVTKEAPTDAPEKVDGSTNGNGNEVKNGKCSPEKPSSENKLFTPLIKLFKPKAPKPFQSAGSIHLIALVKACVFPGSDNDFREEHLGEIFLFDYHLKSIAFRSSDLILDQDSTLAQDSASSNFLSDVTNELTHCGFNSSGHNEKDLESGEVATELLDKNNKLSEDNNGVNKTEQKIPAMEPDQLDGETKISPKHENKPSEETETMVIDVKTGESKEKGKGAEMPSKPTPHLWRQRITRLPRLSKWILAGVCTLLALLVIIITITAFRASRAIDIGTLIIDGKYINTITSCGPIQGVVENGGYAFRGIPYALPPVGELRWKQARTHHHLHHCWNGTYLAHNHSIPCWQFYRNGSYDGSEDCLYLNVFTPKVYYDTPLPVVVFVGGESLGGGESAYLQPSAALARAKNVVFVSVSIRRSVLGFLTLDVLSRNSYPMSSGNYGLSDLLAALKWIHYNAEHFGGDRNQVTLLGHQSGATLVSALMSSHIPKQLFHQVWVSGGSPISTLISFQDAEIQNAGFMGEIECTTVECLHSKNPEELLEAIPYKWRAFHQDLPTKNESKHHWLVRDGLILRDSPSSNIHIQTEVPFVAGAPAEIDASSEMFSYLNWNDTGKFSDYLESKLGTFGTSLSREVQDRYFRPESTPWQQFASLLSDVRTICPLYYSTTFLANQFRTERAYFYVVTQRKHSPIGLVADANADIAAILGVYEAQTREEKLYAKNMEKLFYGFVEKGKFPDDHDVTKSIYLVDESIQKIFTYPNCDFWHQHNFYPNYSRID